MTDDGVDLFWLPLGAGGHSVRWNGRLYEALAAWHEHRSRRDIYHAALQVQAGGVRHVVEMTPVWSDADPARGVVVEGPVGARWLGRSRLFRYEVRCWRDGTIPDLAEAVASPVRTDADPASVLDLVRGVPSFTWGRDEARLGEMWNSNAMVAWLLARAGQDMGEVRLPDGGRAPGWWAGVALADRQRVAVSR